MPLQKIPLFFVFFVNFVVKNKVENEAGNKKCPIKETCSVTLGWQQTCLYISCDPQTKTGGRATYFKLELTMEVLL